MNQLWSIDWHTLFVPSGSLAEIALRGTLIYLFLFALMRALHRGAGQFNIADLLVVVIIADAAQNGMAGSYESVTEGVVLIGTIVAWDFGLDWASFRWPAVRRFVQPQAVTLIRDGKIQWRTMRRELITEAELMGRLHQDGLQHIEDVHRCYVEADGKLSVISHEQAKENAARRRRREEGSKA